MESTHLFDVEMTTDAPEQKETKRIEVEQKLKMKEMQRIEQKQEKHKDLDKEKDPDEDYRIIDAKVSQAMESIKVVLGKWNEL